MKSFILGAVTGVVVVLAIRIMLPTPEELAELESCLKSVEASLGELTELMGQIV